MAYTALCNQGTEQACKSVTAFLTTHGSLLSETLLFFQVVCSFFLLNVFKGLEREQHILLESTSQRQAYNCVLRLS